MKNEQEPEKFGKQNKIDKKLKFIIFNQYLKYLKNDVIRHFNTKITPFFYVYKIFILEIIRILSF